VAFGKPDGGPAAPVQASILPMMAHLALVFMAGIWLPPPLVAWFKNVAVLLG
jgi:hydrogenase-4 component F